MQGTARAEIFLDELTGFPVQIRPGRRSLPENPGRAAFGIPAETVEDVQVVVDRLRRFDEDRIILIRKQFQFQAGVVIAVIGNGREWRTGPFDAIDGEAVPGEGFLDGDVFLSRSTCSTKETIEFEGETYPLVKLEISNTSHPFYTGKSKLVDTAGRVDKFMSRYGNRMKK